MGSAEERKRLLGEDGCQRSEQRTHLNVFFAAACIVDQFGVNAIVVLPRTVILCGWVGYLLGLFVFSLAIYTAMLLGRCWVIAEHLNEEITLKRRYPYAALAATAWGRAVGKVINVYINIGLFGSNIPALLVASQNLQFFVSSISSGAFSFSYCYWLIILGVGLCPLTWLGSPKDSKWISVISTWLVVLAAVITWTCMITDESKSVVYGDVPQPSWRRVGVTFGVLAFQFGCHPSILTIQTDMHESARLPVTVLFSFLATGVLSAITVAAASLLYGSGTHANLIQGLPPSVALYAGVMSVTLQLFLSSVVGGCSLFQDLEDKLRVPTDLCWQRCCVRSAMVMLAVLAAEMLPRFDLAMGLLGGLFTSPITFIVPPLLYKKFRKMLADENTARRKANAEPPRRAAADEDGICQNSRREPVSSLKRHLFALNVDLEEGDCTLWERLLLVCVFCTGVSAAASATYFSVSEAFAGRHPVPPCVVDVASASALTEETFLKRLHSTTEKVVSLAPATHEADEGNVCLASHPVHRRDRCGSGILLKNGWMGSGRRNMLTANRKPLPRSEFPI